MYCKNARLQLLKLQLKQHKGCEKNAEKRERTNGKEDDDETFYE